MSVTIGEIVRSMKAASSPNGRLVKDWREEIPKGSKWSPNSPGDPACPDCLGMGWVRLDLPIGHKFFGKVFECECVARMMARKANHNE